MITEEPLLFEISCPGQTAVAMSDTDVPPVQPDQVIPKALLADAPPPLPEIGPLDLVRHYTALAHRLFSIDQQFYPLGSCTMKYNPRVNEKALGLSGSTDLHPYQRDEDVQGLLEMMHRLAEYLAEVGGMAEVSLQPAAGAHGEMTGLLIINAYHRDRGQKRSRVLTPDTAHGTNPASCVMCGNTLVTVKSQPDGRVDLADLRSKVDADTAALMITNPNTCGKFDSQIGDIADLLHKAGAQFYLDGANMNAVMGITRPGDFGVDVMHYNTHKTFSTPHGCGGPGAGPVGVAEHLRPFLPVPVIVRRENGTYGWDYNRPRSIGKVRSFYGQIGVLVRAYAYIRSLGAEGLRSASEKAVLAANYVAARIRHRYTMPFPPPYAHEFITVPDFEGTEIREVDFAKRLLDYHIHPPTMSWPIHHCLMIEPTETESKRTLDRFCDVLLALADEAEQSPETLRTAPHQMPIGRLDEVAAARKPVVRWRTNGG